MAHTNIVSIQFISPNSLLLGRTSKFQPIVTPPKIEENRIRLKIISTFKSQFWDLYIKSLAGNSTLFKYQNWYKQNRIPQVGDIVLIAYKSKITDSYRIGRITKIYLEKGRVKDVDLLVSPLQDGTIKNFKTAVPMLKIPVQRTVLLLPNNPNDEHAKKDKDIELETSPANDR